MGRVVLVTGVGNALGERLAHLMSTEPGIARVIGVDTGPPPADLGGFEFVRSALRGPTVPRLITGEGVDTVVHLNIRDSPDGARGRTFVRESNVLGSMQLLAACQRAPRLTRVVVRSTGAVYGASPRDPVTFTEDTEAKELPQGGCGADCIEVEGYARRLARRRPDLGVLVLRLAELIGPDSPGRLARYLGLPALPAVLGFDPRFQLLHTDDALAAFRAAATGPATGAVNVAGDGVITLTQAAGLVGRPLVPVPPPLTGPVGRLVHGMRLRPFTGDQARFFRYGRVLDTSRMRSVLGVEPRWSTRDALVDHVRRLRKGAPSPGERAVRLEARLFTGLAGFAQAMADSGTADRSACGAAGRGTPGRAARRAGARR